jgi:hypothetical protein
LLQGLDELASACLVLFSGLGSAIEFEAVPAACESLSFVGLESDIRDTIFSGLGLLSVASCAPTVNILSTDNKDGVFRICINISIISWIGFLAASAFFVLRGVVEVLFA